MKIDLIGFDADDTLWHTEVHYLKAQEDFKQLLSPWAAPERTQEIVNESILDNLARYGYGIKAFILSLIEAGSGSPGARLTRIGLSRSYRSAKR
jgi:putative hydrolase of the HAD superfamily